MLKRPHYIALATVALLTLVVLNLPGQAGARLKVAIGSLFLPLLGLANSTQQAAASATHALTPRNVLLRENELLRREVLRLQTESLQARETERQNARARQLLGWQQNSPWKLRSARVTLREPANWWRSAQINLGHRDGVRTNLAVLTSDGLVGRIAAVAFTHSQVVLLGDSSCKVSAVVQNETRDTGVLGTAGPFAGSLLTLTFPGSDVNLKPGLNVLTSGIGGIFPPGIPIGRIVDFRPAEYGLLVEARVKPSANFGTIEEVWVLFP